MTLDRAPLKTRHILVGSDVDPGLGRRMAQMGLRLGSQLEVISRTPAGGRVISVNGCRLALDKQLSSQLRVQAA